MGRNPCGLTLYIIQIFVTWRTKNIYGVDVRISTLYKIFEDIQMWQRWMTPVVIQSILAYTCIWFMGVDFDNVHDIKTFSNDREYDDCCGLTPSFHLTSENSHLYFIWCALSCRTFSIIKTFTTCFRVIIIWKWK